MVPICAPRPGAAPTIEDGTQSTSKWGCLCLYLARAARPDPLLPKPARCSQTDHLLE